MRISDWSSDVCSSDLLRADRDPAVVVCLQELLPAVAVDAGAGAVRDGRLLRPRRPVLDPARRQRPHGPALWPLVAAHQGLGRCLQRAVPDLLPRRAAVGRRRFDLVQPRVWRAQPDRVAAVYVADTGPEVTIGGASVGETVCQYV